MYGITPSEAKIMKDLVRELSEFNNYVRDRSGPLGQKYKHGNYFYAFNPEQAADREMYQKSIKLLNTINEVLDENCVNIKSQGYTYLKDAICIIIDRRSLDVCLVKEVYPFIAEKHKIKKTARVEHSIRNSLDSAYKTFRTRYPDRDCLLNSFDRKPTNKKFLLRAVQEVSNRLLKEIVCD